MPKNQFEADSFGIKVSIYSWKLLFWMTGAIRRAPRTAPSAGRLSLFFITNHFCNHHSHNRCKYNTYYNCRNIWIYKINHIYDHTFRIYSNLGQVRTFVICRSFWPARHRTLICPENTVWKIFFHTVHIYLSGHKNWVKNTYQGFLNTNFFG